MGGVKQHHNFLAEMENGKKPSVQGSVQLESNLRFHGKNRRRESRTYLRRDEAKMEKKEFELLEMLPTNCVGMRAATVSDFPRKTPKR